MANYKLDYTGNEVNDAITTILTASMGGTSIKVGTLARSSSGAATIDLGADVKAVFIVPDSVPDSSLDYYPSARILFPDGKAKQINYAAYYTGSTDSIRYVKATLSTAGILSITEKGCSADYIAFY